MSNTYTRLEIQEFLHAANADLGANKVTGEQSLTDYCKAVVVGQQLQSQLAEAKKQRDEAYNRGYMDARYNTPGL